jgi:zinc protease
MRSFSSAFDQADLDAHLPDVLDQLRRGGAYAATDAQVVALNYGPSHPYRNGPGGDREDLTETKLEDVRAFARKLTPAGAILVLAGNFDPILARQLIEEDFAGITPGIVSPGLETKPRPATSVMRASVGQKKTLPARFDLIWPNDVRPFSAEYAAGKVVAAVLEEGRSSRLYKSLVGQGLASKVATNAFSNALGGGFSISLTGLEGSQPEDLQQALQSQLDKLRGDPPSQEEIDVAVRKLVTNRLRYVEPLGARADRFVLYELYTGDAGFLPRELALLRAVTPAAAQAFVRERLPDAARIELSTRPLQ